MNEPHIHVGIMRRFHGPNGARTEITINLSGIPATASPELIDLMMGTADVAVDRLLDETEKRARAAVPGPKPAINPEAFGVTAQRAPDTMPLGDRIDQTVRNLIGADAPPQVHAVDKVTGEILLDPETLLGDLTPEQCAEIAVAMSAAMPSAPIADHEIDTVTPLGSGPTFADAVARELEKASAELLAPGAMDTEPEGEDEEIFDADFTVLPNDDEVRVGGTAFGIHIAYPPLEWSAEPLSTVGVDGGPGQLTAVNAAISNLGYGGRLRHPACLAILQAYGPFNDRPAPDSIESVYDLSKAQAHVILEWIEKSARTPLALRDLANAVHIIRTSKETPKTHV